MRTIRVLFVCLGNICRSPTAHGVFQTMVEKVNLAKFIDVDSAGTSGWHIGEPPDKRSSAEALKAGYDLRNLRGRQVQKSDFEVFDYILAMDRANLVELEEMRPENYSGHLGLFLEFSQDENYTEVPDPYYGGGEGFRTVLSLVESASTGLLAEIRNKYL